MQPNTRSEILLTRPMQAAQRFANALRCELGGETKIILSPLTHIEMLQRNIELSGINALVFTSMNGIDAFVSQNERRDISCYTVGDATARRAQEYGMQAISCKGDARALIARILSDGQKGPILHIRGKHSRGHIAENLTQSGCHANSLILYQQITQTLNKNAIALLERENRVIVPLFSPRVAAQFKKQFKGNAQINVVAISDEVARIAGFANVVVADSPNALSMLATVKGLYDAG